ncbi:extensin family protein [Ferrovibrio xuzhouensis]|uniref:Extensin family protein n=1 Tax=Ferrovibrio xuzhouensis TaxID=1576914 RepID=A0ABV7VHA1_9PROT
MAASLRVTGLRVNGRRLTAAALLLLAAACAPRSQPPAAPPVTVPPPGMHLWPNRDVIQSACLNDLAATGAEFELVAQAEPGKDGCDLVNGVKLLRLPDAALSRPVELTCPTALRFTEFEREVLQPTARRMFGQPLIQVNHAGGFTCRRMVGGGGRLSEHAHGRAIDIWGFVLGDGTKLSVTEQFRTRGGEGSYLREVSRAACTYFNVVLSPNANSDHKDHFHWDIGRWKQCSG